MFFLAHFCIKILKNPKKILVIIQRSNGDVFLSSSLIRILYQNYDKPKIDILINDDTISVAKLIPFIQEIFSFSYKEKKENRWNQEKKIISKIFKKYDLSINLTASDRSVFYSVIAAKKSISAIEKNFRKSWWKRFLLHDYYYFDSSKHILINNLEPINLLRMNHESIHYPIEPSQIAIDNIIRKLENNNIGNFIIFHPSTQYMYKVYPKKLRDSLIKLLSKLGVSIIITGSNSEIDAKIKKEIPDLPNVFDFIGETSLEEFIALSKLSLGYIGMDTLTMHIAASQDKRIFAIFGPTNLKMWSPWSNQLKLSASQDMPIQTYGEITIFQANMPCVACGKAGCNDDHGSSDCLDNINPNFVFREIKNWYLNSNNQLRNIELNVE